MRKAITALLSVTLAPLCATAQTADTPTAPVQARDLFFAVYAKKPNFKMRIEGSEVQDSEIDVSTVGVAFAFGQKLYEGIGFDVEAGTLSVKIASRNQTSSADNLNMLLGLKWPFLKATRADTDRTLFVVYIGSGLGFSSWSNFMDYHRESYIPDGTIIKEEHSTSRKTNLSYQAKFGTTFVLTDRFDLDFNIKYQNLGPTGNIGPAFGLPGDVSNMEYRAGVMYKLGI